MPIPPGWPDPHLHLFLTDEEVDSLAGVTRLINPMRRESLEPVLGPDRPWEMGQVVPRRVLHDPGIEQQIPHAVQASGVEREDRPAADPPLLQRRRRLVDVVDGVALGHQRLEV